MRQKAFEPTPLNLLSVSPTSPSVAFGATSP